MHFVHETILMRQQARVEIEYHNIINLHDHKTISSHPLCTKNPNSTAEIPRFNWVNLWFGLRPLTGISFEYCTTLVDCLYGVTNLISLTWSTATMTYVGHITPSQIPMLIRDLNANISLSI